MIFSIALGAAQGVALLDAMATDLAKTNRLSGTLVVQRPGQQPAKAVFYLTKPNRFQVKGAGIDVWFDGTTRYDMKDGKWVAVSKDGSLPVALRGMEGFFGRKVVAKGPAIKTKGVPGVGYTVADNVVFYINEKSKLPVGRSRTDANGKTIWVYYKDVKSANPVVAANKPAVKVAKNEDPLPLPTGVSVPLTMGTPKTTLVELKTEEMERPNPPVPVAQVPNDASAATRGDQVANDPAMIAAKLPKVGDTAQMFSANLPSGAQVELGKLLQKSQGVVLVFWHANCPASADYIAHLELMRPEMAKNKAFLLGVNCGDSSTLVKQYLSDKKSGMTTVLGAEVAELYQVTGHPTTIVLDKEGKVVASFIGANESALKAALEAIKPAQ